jgi:Fungal Zn(2)-Cys(6) binuclear cluster domain
MSTNAPPPKAHPGIVNTGSRPYRSHKVRACDLCRKRKSRCTVDIPGQSCVLCRIQGADCHYQEDSMPEDSQIISSDKHSSASPSLNSHKRKRGSEIVEKGIDNYENPPSKANGSSTFTVPSESRDTERSRRKTTEDPHNESVLIVGPVAAEDAQVIEKFMPSEQSNKSVEKGQKPYNVYSNDPRKPILYTTVSRRRQGMRLGSPPGENQKEILEHLLGPFKQDLVRLYVSSFIHLRRTII